jgi:hypothetical protein
MGTMHTFLQIFYTLPLAAVDSCPAGKPPIGPVSPIGMKALSSSGDEPQPHENVGSPGRQTPGYRGTLDRRPRHSNVQHANKSTLPPPPIVDQLYHSVPTLISCTRIPGLAKGSVAR